MGESGTIVTIGNFDGVHAGHRALVFRARALAGPAGRVVAMAFDPHPASVLRPESAPARVTAWERRAALLVEAGADVVRRLEPTAELLSMSPESFVEDLVGELGPSWLVEGEDFRFGRARAGDVSTLRALGERMGFGVEVVPTVEVALEDNTVVPASSTVLRWLIERGRVRDAARVLGRAYELEGVVARGERRGREIGFPTINIETDALAPADGIYAGTATLPDGRRIGAAVSVGTKPTFGGTARAVEAHLLDAAREGERIAGLEEYGWGVRLALVGWVRDQVRFGSAAALVEQMERDCARVREVLGAECAGAWT